MIATGTPHNVLNVQTSTAITVCEEGHHDTSPGKRPVRIGASGHTHKGDIRYTGDATNRLPSVFLASSQIRPNVASDAKPSGAIENPYVWHRRKFAPTSLPMQDLPRILMMQF